MVWQFTTSEEQMARSLNPDNYPEYYGKALLGVYNSGREIKIDTPTPSRLRQRLYAYINALDKREDKTMTDWEHRFAPRYRQVSITAHAGYVLLSSKNHGPEADAFAEALDGLGNHASSTPTLTPEEQTRLEEQMKNPDLNPDGTESTSDANPFTGYGAQHLKRTEETK
jgi:hypothetical protein